VRSEESVNALIAQTVAVSTVPFHEWHTKSHTYSEIRPPRRPRLQLRRHLVGVRLKHAPQALPAHAARQPGGPLRRHPGRPTAPPQVRQGRPHRRRQPAHLQPLLPRQDRLRHGQGRHERPDKGLGHGFCARGAQGHGHYEHLARSGEFIYP
jgi:hypothetical protein